MNILRLILKCAKMACDCPWPDRRWHAFAAALEKEIEALEKQERENTG